MAFLVTEFVLVMQFLWKYIDEIIGKGVSLGILLELIFYWSVRIIPEAVPVSILIASVMVFGNLAEKYELSSMKSAGISLTRIMGMGIFIAVLTSMFSLFASNYMKPRANYKFIYRYNAIKRAKPALSIEEGVFNKDFRNITIRVGDKGRDGQSISDILVYDHSVQDKREVNVLTAKEGLMYAGEDNDYFVMELKDGVQYREMKDKKAKPDDKKPNAMMRTRFESWTKIFDLSEFELEAQNVNLTRKKYDLLNAFQLKEAIDSFQREIVDNEKSNLNNFSKLLSYEMIDPVAKSKEETLPTAVTKAIKSKDEIVEDNQQKLKRSKAAPRQKETLDLKEYNSIIESFESKDIVSALTTAKHRSERNNDKLLKSSRMEDSLAHSQSLYVLRLNQQFSWALICILFLFIGASLGSIVKKGGYGYPLLIAIIFFMLFIILNIMGEKLTKSSSVPALLGAWLPYVVLLPTAVLLTYKALNDSDFSYLKNLFQQVFHRLFPAKDA